MGQKVPLVRSRSRKRASHNDLAAGIVAGRLHNDGAMVAPYLVGIDFSDGSLAALESARFFAGLSGSPVELFHVRQPGAGGALEPDPATDGWLSRAGVSPEQIAVRTGGAAVELARAATAHAALAVIIGSHGASGAQPVALGSTAARLSLIAPCPVIVVNSVAGRPIASAAASQVPNPTRTE